MQVLFHTDIEREAGHFDIDDVADAACKKLVYRHPHVFRRDEPDAPDWDEYEAEQARAQRHRKKLAAIYDRDERFREEKEIEDAGN